MVGRDTVTFRFRLDAKEMQRLIKALEADAKRMGATIERVGTQTDAASAKIKSSGDRAAAAAINFQTATTGMMNLGTAAVQTITSISNLDRAENRLAQSHIAVARAEDLLAAKKLRLNELQEKGLGNTTKAINLTNELATAEADLAVKRDKARIEEGALLDIQMLFVTNVANVMISSIQTIKTLRDLQALSTIKATIAESGLITKMKALVLTQGFATKSAMANTVANKGLSFSIKGLTFSVRGLMIALGPVAIAITAVTLAMQAYEENTHGFRDAIQSALPFLKDENDELEKSEQILRNNRNEAEGYISAIDNMGKSMKKLQPQHKLYLEMHRDAFLAMDKNSKLAAYYSSQLAGLRTGPQGFSTPSVGGGLPSRGGISVGGGTVAGGGVTTAGGVSTGGVSSAPTTGGVGTPTTVTGASELLGLADPHGTREQRFVFSMLPKQEKMSVLLNKAQLSMNDGLYGTANILFAEYEKIKAQPEMETDPVKRWENMQKGANLKETGFRLATERNNPEVIRKVTAEMQQFKFGTDLFSMDRFDQTHAGTKRGEIMNLTGVDIGNIANVIDKNDAIKLANLQRSMSQFNQPTPGATGGRSGGRTDLVLDVLNKAGQAWREMSDINDMVSTNVFRSGSNYFGKGFFKSTGATAAYQVANVATPKHIMKAIRNQDSFANGIGRYLENLTALLTGKKQKLQYRNSFDHKTQTYLGESRKTLDNALDFGFRSNQDFVEKLNQSLVDIEPRKEGALGRARQNVKTSVTLAEQFLKMQFGLLRGIGIESTTVSAIAGEVGLQGDLPTGFLNNLQVLSQMQRSDFNNYDIIHESKNKLNMTNQEVFAIRFDAKRGDDELLDRIRFQDRLEAMSSGTSAF